MADATEVLRAQARRARMLRSLLRLRFTGADDLTGPLRRALREAALSGAPRPAEVVPLTRIEDLRSELLASEEPLEVLDFGAGGADLELTPEEMASGRVLTSTRAEVCRVTSKPATWARVLFRLARERRPVSCLELGTSLGISTAYQATALELNGAGRIISLEGAPAVAGLARENLSRLGLTQRAEVRVGRFEDTLPAALADAAPLDYVFVDGHHDERATLAYFETIVPATAPGALLAFDDVEWSAGMRRAWQAIANDRRLTSAASTGQIGFALRAPER